MISLKNFTDNVTERLAIEALTHATKTYDAIPKDVRGIKKRGFILLLVMTALYFLVDYYSDSNKSIFYKQMIVIPTVMFGGLYCYMWPKYFSRIKKFIQDILNVDMNNKEALISHFDKVIYPAIYGRPIYETVLYALKEEAQNDNPIYWKNFSTQLTDKEIEILLSLELTDNQKQYIKDTIFNNKKITYENLNELNTMNDSKLLDEKEEAFKKFLLDKNIQNKNLKDKHEIEYEKLL